MTPRLEGRLEGRRVLVVGAGTQRSDDPEAPIGNGRAISVLAAREGAAVACADVRRDAAAETARLVTEGGGRAEVVVGDVTDEQSCAQMVADAAAALGGLDGLVCNVGIGLGRGLEGTTVDDWATATRNSKPPDRAPNSSCRELMALLRRAPNSFVTQLEQHVTLAAAKLWGVQLAAGFDRNKALAMYARAMKRLSAVIGDQDPSLLSSVMRTRGTHAFYQVRIGADTRPAADDLCNRIRRAGGACFVLRNRV